MNKTVEFGRIAATFTGDEVVIGMPGHHDGLIGPNGVAIQIADIDDVLLALAQFSHEYKVVVNSKGVSRDSCPDPRRTIDNFFENAPEVFIDHFNSRWKTHRIIEFIEASPNATTEP